MTSWDKTAYKNSLLKRMPDLGLTFIICLKNLIWNILRTSKNIVFYYGEKSSQIVEKVKVKHNAVIYFYLKVKL